MNQPIQEREHEKTIAWFKLLITTLKLTIVMNPTDVGRAFTAVAKLLCLGEEPEGLNGNARFLFAELLNNVEESDDAYQKRCAINRENGKKHKGKKGKNPSDATENPKGSQPLADGLEERRTEERSTEERDKTPMIPPTPREVALFCQQEGIQVDAEKFVNHYTSIGWLRGNTPIRDWKACVRNWHLRERDFAAGAAPETAVPVTTTKASPIALQAVQRLLAEEGADIPC